ncbi:MAG: hypothetical protein EH225_04820, partial [Calditrichaeota bacterium]
MKITESLISILIFLISVMLLATQCAHKAPPGGGPEDKTPPEIVNHYPPQDSVNISSLEYIEIEFSESVRKTSLSGNYWIMPELPEEIEVKWKGSQKARFFLGNSLERDQTYVFTLSTGITDMRNNRLVAPFQMAFSTGENLDRGSVKGQVLFERSQEPVYVYAYIWNAGEDPDSLLKRKPRYYTEIDANGFYQLNYLSLETYRLLAVQDKDYNEVYNIESDNIGIPFMDVSLDSLHESFFDINFVLINEDTTSSYISRLDTLSNQEIVLEMNEDITLLDSFYAAAIDSGDMKFYPSAGKGQELASPNRIFLYFQELPPGRELSLQMSGLTDESGNKILEDTLSRSFVAATRPDTVNPRFQNMIPSPGSGTVSYDATIQLNLNVPVDTSFWKNCFSLKDSTGESVPGQHDFTQLSAPVFQPAGLLEPGMKYWVNLDGRSLVDLWGRSFPDTLYMLNFTTIDMAQLGEISGRVYSSSLEWQQALIEAQPLRGKEIYQTMVQKNEQYFINYLPDGLYMLKAILDLNRNGEWDKGGTNPWQ